MFGKINFSVSLLLVFAILLLAVSCNAQEPSVEGKSTIIQLPSTSEIQKSVSTIEPETQNPVSTIEPETQNPVSTIEPESEKKTKPESNEPVPIMSQEEKELAVAIIVGYREVTAAEITQENSILDLVLVVKPGTGNTPAKKLGDQFIRTVKTVGPDENPPTYGNRQIGTGKFNYYIGIYYPDKTELLMGTKFAVDSTISW